ncbi:hypothetical protein RBB50_004227 [Rhinocladiella similis]
MAYHLLPRDIINDVKSAPETFSSWDKCMQKAYCKWPAIIGIVVGSLILLSLIWCFARCLCCGAELCACCVRCCPCGSSGRRRDRTKFQDDYSRMPPTPYGGYQPAPAPAPMAYGANPMTPQFATFEEPSKKINEDSLPPMPSWDTAVKRRVEDTSEPLNPNYQSDLEMGRLEPPQPRMRGGYNTVPSGPTSPIPPQTHEEYFDHTHSYQSDLGAQRINSNNYNNFQSVPLSPPPTYRSHSVAPSITSDRFRPGVVSPTPAEYGQPYHQPYSSPQPSYTPSGVNTRYEPPADYSSNRISMLSMPEPQNTQSQYQARPPSFLQVGRKPLNGSLREV